MSQVVCAERHVLSYACVRSIMQQWHYAVQGPCLVSAWEPQQKAPLQLTQQLPPLAQASPCRHLHLPLSASRQLHLRPLGPRQLLQQHPSLGPRLQAHYSVSPAQLPLSLGRLLPLQVGSPAWPKSMKNFLMEQSRICFGKKRQNSRECCHDELVIDCCSQASAALGWSDTQLACSFLQRLWRGLWAAWQRFCHVLSSCRLLW